jgi:hypothetical protein
MWDFPNYEISNLGNIRNAKTERNLVIRQDGKEYRMVTLWANKKVYTKRVGRYVWMSHNKQFCNAYVDHINKDAGDDRIENLRCISPEQNRAERQNYKRGNKYNLSKKDKGYIHKSLADKTETTWTIMKKYDVPLNYIQTTFKRKSWLKYVEQLES